MKLEGKKQKSHIPTEIAGFRKKFGAKKKTLPLTAYYGPIESLKSLFSKIAVDKRVAASVSRTFSRLFK